MSKTWFYRCDKCGNMVAFIKTGGGTLTCCGQEMTNLRPNSTNGTAAHHVPVLTMGNGKMQVAVGSEPHPMTAEHFIEWIALASGNQAEIVHLKPGMEPKAEFPYDAGEEEIPFTGKNDEIVPNCEAQPCNFVLSGKTTKEAVVYAYCSLHGLWKAGLSLTEADKEA